MRDSLPDQIKDNEYGVVNLDSFKGPGTHWVAYGNKWYFDSYGLPPPKEILKYVNQPII